MASIAECTGIADGSYEVAEFTYNGTQLSCPNDNTDITFNSGTFELSGCDPGIPGKIL